MAFCADPSIQITAYRFLDANGNAIVDPTTDDPSDQGPVMVTMQTVLTDRISTEVYTTFSVAPGNLWSYTPQAWNARMSALASANPSPLLYGGSNYFNDVIVANAYQFPSGRTTVPHLEVAWAPGSSEPLTFKGTSESFTERSWTLDSKVYVGVSGGEEASLFGFGEAFEFQFLAGVEAQDDGNVVSTSDDEWGITLAAPWGPPAPSTTPSGPPGVIGYTFRIYFLPVPPAPGVSTTLPPTYWAQEMRQYLGVGAGDQISLTLTGTLTQEIPVTITYPAAGSSGLTTPASIDPNSGCWRIAFVVTRIELTDGTVWVYDGSLGDK